MILSSLMSRSGDGIEVQAEPNVQEKFEYLKLENDEALKDTKQDTLISLKATINWGQLP